MKNKNLILVCIMTMMVQGYAHAQQPRHMLEQEFSRIAPSEFRQQGWCPYPDYHDRKAWDEMTGARKESYIKAGERYLNYDWPRPLASEYLEFERTGDRMIMERKEHGNAGAMVSLFMAELAEGKGRFIDQIINGCWAHTERTTWVWSAHQYRQSSGRALPDGREVFIDLGSQSIGLMLSMTLYFFHEEIDAVDPSICVAIRRALEEKYFQPYMNEMNRGSQSWIGDPDPRTGKISWWEAWHPVNNWNAWCNSHVFISALYAIQDQDRLYEIVRQTVRSMDRYLDNVTMDGACSEGPHYWAHAAANVYHFLEFMGYATGGKMHCYDDPQIRAMMNFAARAHIGGEWYFNYGDCPPRLHVRSADYWQIGKVCGDDELTDLACYLGLYEGDVSRNPRPAAGVFHKTLDYLMSWRDYESEVAAALSAENDPQRLRDRLKSRVPAVSWYPDAELFYAKTPSGLQFSAKGGHNQEGHSHNDVGSFILFSNDVPLFIDLGMPEYRRETFSSERYTIWVMRSEWHNLPVINGVAQQNGREFCATGTQVDEKMFGFRTDISSAYPADAACSSWNRSYAIKGKTLTISDSYTLSERKAADEEHFMVQGEAVIVRPGEILVTGHSLEGDRTVRARLKYSPAQFNAEIETVEVSDSRIRLEWGETLRRIVLKGKDNAPLKGKYSFNCEVID